MSDLAIRVEKLGKQYRIGAGQSGYRTFREALIDGLSAPVRRLRGLSPDGQDQTIWALRDVSFDVKPGEVLGIIGRNGAGKSTLLKILSRITEPTEGYAEIQGRIGSLLEVGTGFHPELTGRDNIYLNGAILGMKRDEILRKFDEIVAFAEVEKFIDTPVKHYSTGMYLRLAFAVAAHREPDILLIDEVLAVGDAAFQKKCLGKMGDVAKEGRTVLFVSHQMNSIRKLCQTCLWLDGGQIRMAASPLKAVSAYEAAMRAPFRDGEIGEVAVASTRVLGWKIIEPRVEEPNVLRTLGAITFKVTFQVGTPIRDGVHGIALWNSDGQLMWAWAAYNLRVGPGVHGFIYTLPGLPLRPGAYTWQVSLYDGGTLLDNCYCVPQLIVATDPMTHPLDEWTGVLNVPCNFWVEGSSTA